jgi:hypothetical protein
MTVDARPVVTPWGRLAASGARVRSQTERSRRIETSGVRGRNRGGGQAGRHDVREIQSQKNGEAEQPAQLGVRGQS